MSVWKEDKTGEGSGRKSLTPTPETAIANGWALEPEWPASVTFTVHRPISAESTNMTSTLFSES